jgi:hypothetical protein
MWSSGLCSPVDGYERLEVHMPPTLKTEADNTVSQSRGTQSENVYCTYYEN